MVTSTTQRLDCVEERLAGLENQMTGIEGKLNTQEDTLTRVVAAAVRAAMEEEWGKIEEALKTQIRRSPREISS